ncbi:cellulose biosynthesis cyclic di-GMP-binding regulatory protein BcsB [Methylothermus subterraneus]
MRRFLSLMLALAFMSLNAQSAELSLPLAKLMRSPGPIELRDQADEYALSLPVPERWQVKSARLVLEFASSNALVAERSQLRVQVNRVTVAQWRLEPKATKRIETVSIPPELLVAGYNELRFSAAQHYTKEHCEAYASKELWTEIDPARSRVVLEYAASPPPLSLARLAAVFDKKLPQIQAALLYPNPLDEADLIAGGLIAQGIALRSEYAPFGFALAQAEPELGPGPIRLAWPKEQDAVLIGARERLAPYLDPQLLARITGPYLGLFADPRTPGQVLLVVSGQTAAEVRQAALAFALLRFPLPDAHETVIAKVDFAPFLPYQALPALLPGHTYTFAQLGFATASRQGLDPEPLELEFFLPPDAFAPEDAEAVFWLHLAYNAGLRGDSAIEMRINGVFERAIALPETGGAHYRDYRILVPLRSLRPGRNRISFHPHLVPAVSGECVLLNVEPLKVTLYQDSRLTLPAFSHAARLPDLALLAAAGFPYLDSGDGSGVRVYLLDRSPDTILAAWQWLAQLARLNGLPLPAVEFGFDAPTGPADLIVIGGQVKKLPALFQNSPLKLDDPFLSFLYPAGWQAPPQPWWQRWQRRLFPTEARLLPRQVKVQQTGGLGELAALVSFQHPAFSRRLITALLAEGPIYPAVQDLTRPERWAQIQGDLVFWRKGADTLHWQAVGEPFYRGRADPALRLIFHFAHHPWQWLAAALLAGFALAWGLYRGLKRYKKRHHPDAEEVAP